MKLYKFFAISVLAALASCTVKEGPVSESKALRFTSNLEYFGTKATERSFELGDAVSLFVEEPLNELNVKMTFSGNELIPEHSIVWPEDMDKTAPVSFFAVYPYREDWVDLVDLNVFSVEADQSTHEAYTASDLMGANFMAYADAETIPLNFIHRMSRVVIENYSDVDVKDIYLRGVYGKARVGVWYGTPVATVGEKGMIRTGKLSSPYSGGRTWVAVVPPQEADFEIVVVTAEDEQIVCKSSRESVTMESARQYSIGLSIDKNAATAISLDVTEWTPEPDAQFGAFVADEFHTEGDWYLRMNGVDETLMTQDSFGGLHFETGFTAGISDTYDLIYRIGRMELVFGLARDADAAISEGKNLLVQGGKPFSALEAGEYVLNVDPEHEVFFIAPDDEVWSLIGTYKGTNWDEDFDMTRESSGVYSIDIDYWGEKFKFRCNHDWSKNLGGPQLPKSDNPLKYTVWYDGADMTISEPGRYHLTLNVRDKWIKAEFLEAYVPEALDSFVGSWMYWFDDESFIPITISQDGLQLNIEYDGRQFKARFNTGDSSFNVYFQRLREWTWSSYGLTYDWPKASYSIPDDDGDYWLYGELSDLILFTGKINDDGAIDIQPGLSYNGYPFTSFEVLAVIQEGDYEGAYRSYGVVYPLPQTWTKSE